MKPLFLTTLFLATLCATSYGQTIKALGYNTTNNRIIGPTNTNALVFTNVTSFEVDAFFNGGDIRIGSGALYFGGTERINLEENRFAGVWEFDQPASWRTNLGLGATWLTNDNVTNFRTAIGLGATNDAFIGNDGGSITTDQVFAGGVDLYASSAAITFGTNNTNGAAETRTNLGIPLPALTETSNVTMMRALAGSTNTNEPFSGSVVVDTNTLVFTNGILLEVTTP
jgi:hypothetical protein